MFDLIKSLFKSKTDMSALVQQGAVIVDVRTKAEYHSGHIDGSRNIPLDKIKTEVASLKRLNKPVITVCRSGARSGAAKAVLASAGIEVYNGGAWNSLKKRIQ